MPSTRASRARRPYHWLREQIRSVLDGAEQPISGQDLALLLNEKDKVYHSAVFRALNRMSADGVVRKIELTAGYVILGGEALLYLVCMQCRRVSKVDCLRAADDLAQIASERGFAPTRVVLEMEGTCLACAAGKSRGAEPDVDCAAQSNRDAMVGFSPIVTRPPFLESPQAVGIEMTHGE